MPNSTTDKIACTVYIDEAGDLGHNRGTQWFILSAVIVDKKDEPSIRNTIARLKSDLNVNEIHIRKIKEFPRRAYIVRELNEENFTYINILFDTTKFDITKMRSPIIAYNYVCRMLLERVSWYLDDTNRRGDIVLSSRGTSRDGELIDYIKNKLLPYGHNEIRSSVFKNVLAKSPSQWDMLQLADVCATTIFLAYEINAYNLCYPCFSTTLSEHLYRRNSKITSYGMKYFSNDMKPNIETLKKHRPCTKKERTPSATTT